MSATFNLGPFECAGCHGQLREIQNGLMTCETSGCPGNLIQQTELEKVSEPQPTILEGAAAVFILVVAIILALCGPALVIAAWRVLL